MKVLPRGMMTTLVIELPESDLARRMEIISELHRNRIIYDVDEAGNILIDGFELEKVKEPRSDYFFIKYELSDGALTKWVYVRAKEPGTYYRIKAMHCSSAKSYIKALKRRMLPSSYVKLAICAQKVLEK
ncbi:MAG: hypothetical protein DRJ26_02445 [Candidatus Methanomethylicota archaeon]|mgnify:CR=1 FL=1|uniref:Uncharacterized protein n=1 Tax=Thermoproteota archaeon TaxID=2056631 RepID=A0A497F3I6_9CREN|nr:MAG: hypothetical protein DRJ26_02445 [Candidatus Verstraetearchaeota archaeon]